MNVSEKCANCKIVDVTMAFTLSLQKKKIDEEIRRTPRPIRAEDTIISILFIACDRTTVSRSLDLLMIIKSLIDLLNE